MTSTAVPALRDPAAEPAPGLVPGPVPGLVSTANSGAFDALRLAHDAVAALAVDPGLCASMTDAEALAWNAGLSGLHQSTQTLCSMSAGDIARRSSRALGYSGLAQREGFRTPEKLLQHTTGLTARDASKQVRIGTVLNEAALNDSAATSDVAPVAPSRPWLTEAARAVADGQISVDALDAIRAGLGEPGPGVTEQSLTGAAHRLLEAALTVDPDRLFRLARDARDEIDADCIAERERAIHEQRAFRRVTRPGGLRRYIIDPDLESAAYWDDVYDKITSPRRGGPRFVDPADQDWANTVATDERTIEQYLHDAFTQLLRIGVDADHGNVVSSRAPSVRVLVTASGLESGRGHGRIEGQPVPVSVGTVERIACTTTGILPIVFDDDGQPLSLGREQRLFTHRQRIALAARDGGCRWPECDLPSAWTEAHHIDHWQRDHGHTNIADGIQLCRHHHMLLHNTGWHITRNGANYWLTPPPSIDPEQTPRPMPSKSAALTDLQRQKARTSRPPDPHNPTNPTDPPRTLPVRIGVVAGRP